MEHLPRPHWDALAGLFTVEVLTLRGLVRYHTRSAIELATRKFTAPAGAWIRQIARNLTEAYQGFRRDERSRVLDRDPRFTPAFRRHLAEAGCERLPADSSNDAYAERCVGSPRRECLDRIVPWASATSATRSTSPWLFTTASAATKGWTTPRSSPTRPPAASAAGSSRAPASAAPAPQLPPRCLSAPSISPVATSVPGPSWRRVGRRRSAPSVAVCDPHHGSRSAGARSGSVLPGLAPGAIGVHRLRERLGRPLVHHGARNELRSFVRGLCTCRTAGPEHATPPLLNEEREGAPVRGAALPCAVREAVAGPSVEAPVNLPFQLRFFLLFCAGWIHRQQQDAIDYLYEENRVLLELAGERPGWRLTDVQRRRLAEKAKALGRQGLDGVCGIVTPDTLLRWYRRLVAAKYTARAASAPREAASPPSGRLPERLVALVLRLARENPTYGYTRLQGALANVGRYVSRSSIRRILARHGVPPAPERGARTRWSTFLAAHWEVFAAADFFTVEVLTLRGLVRYHVLFVIELATRRVEIAGVTPSPDGEWTQQIARNLTDAYEGFLRDKRFLILDRDPLFTPAFRRHIAEAGCKPVRLPAKSPNLNAYSERFVGSVRHEVLDRIVPLGERHLRYALREFVAHYHGERNHQGLDNALIEADETVGRERGRIVSRSRLGGLLRYTYRRAA